MPKIVRPSQMLKVAITLALSVFAWLALGILLNKLPFLVDHAHEWLQDNWLPGCALRKQPILHYTDNRQLRIFWEGRCEDKETKLYYSINKAEPSNTDDFEVPENFEYTKLSQRRHLYSALIHNVPGNVTLQYYVIFNKQKTKLNAVKTLPENTGKSTVRLAILGDSQLGVEQFRRHLKTIRKHQPNMFIHLGDMVQHAFKLRDWYRLLISPITSILPAIPMVFVSGNHDWWSGRPNHYIHDRSKTYFSMTINGAKCIFLDSERETSEQTQWLEQELQQGKPNFKIVFVHVPPFVEFWSPKHWKNGDNTWPLYVRKHWLPLFKKWQVDLVLSGHQHNYQRGCSRDGVHLVVSGGGGSKLDVERVEDFGLYKVTSLKHHFVLLDIFGESLQVTALTDDNHIIDSFTIDKKVVKRYSENKN